MNTCKLTLSLALVLGSVFHLNAQNPSVEKHLTNFQIGLLGSWASHEFRLDSTLTLRSEVGLKAGIYYGAWTGTEFVAVPQVSVEPRWYYNLKKRHRKGRNIHNNGANFIGLSTTYTPDWFTISNSGNYRVADEIRIAPSWNIRRSISDSGFDYEFGAGIGYFYSFRSQYNLPDQQGLVLIGRVRFGYSF